MFQSDVHLFKSIKASVKYALRNVNQENKKEEYYERLMHNHLGKLGYETVCEDYCINVNLLGYVDDNNTKTDIEKLHIRYKTNITPDIIIKDKNKRIFIETKVFNRYDDNSYKFIYKNDDFTKITDECDVKNIPFDLTTAKTGCYYMINGKKYRFAFNEGRIWQDIIRMLSIINKEPFYVVVFIPNAKTKSPGDTVLNKDILKHKFKDLVDEVTYETYKCCSYSPKAKFKKNNIIAHGKIDAKNESEFLNLIIGQHAYIYELDLTINKFNGKVKSANFTDKKPRIEVCSYRIDENKVDFAVIIKIEQCLNGEPVRNDLSSQ